MPLNLDRIRVNPNLKPILIPWTTCSTPDPYRELLEVGWLAERRQRKQAKKQEKVDKAALADYSEWLATQDSEYSASPRGGQCAKSAGRPRFFPIMAGHMFTGPTNHVCGLFPFSAGSGSPQTGVPVGKHVLNGSTVAFSVHAWLKHGHIKNPNVAVFGQPGVGKSALGKRIILGEVGFGTLPIIMGDVKPDYIGVVAALGGQIISLGKGKDRLNPLDAGPLAKAVIELKEKGFAAEAALLETDGLQRRQNLLVTLAEIGRRGRLSSAEEVFLASAIRVFDAKGVVSPLISDVIELLKAPTLKMLKDSDYEKEGEDEEYRIACRPLIHTLKSMLVGPLSGVFDGHTTTEVDLSAKAIEFDISSIASLDDERRTAAAMLAVWSYSFAVIDAEIALAEVGLRKPRNYLAVLDEMWRALQGSSQLVDRAAAAVRVNRQRGLGIMMTSHSASDFGTHENEGSRKKGMGIVERCDTVILGAISHKEMETMNEVINGGLNQSEQQLLSQWSAPADWDPTSQHPGIGNFIIKTGDRQGVPIQLNLLPQEIPLYDTNRKMD